MKIVLVFPPFYLEPMYNLPPLGLVNLATVLKGSSHQTMVLDFPLALRLKTLQMGPSIYEACAERILAEAPDLVGISVQCTTYPAALQIARRLKEQSPNVKVVLGGHNVSFVDERTLARYPWVDAVVRGEGEITFPELVDAFALEGHPGGVQGVTYRDGEHVLRNPDRELVKDLDALPLADYGMLAPLSDYRDACGLRRSIAILEVGRGCPHRCVYCSQSPLWRRTSRIFSVDRLVAEMDHLHRAFGAECFLLAYDQFTARRDFVETFCRKVIDARLNHLPWYCISRLDSVDARLLGLMREAGCESMCYGIDSGSKKTLAFIRKNIDQSILYRRVRETIDQGIVPTLSFVIGFPEETEGDLEETMHLALRSGALGNVNPLLQMVTTLPGTDLHSRYQERMVREVDTYFSLGIEFDEGKRLRSDEKMIDSDPVVFSSFYNIPSPARPLRDLNLIADTFHLLASYYPRSFLLLSLECGESLPDLFFHWLEWLKRRMGRKEAQCSPQDCYRYFSTFADEILKARGALSRPHIPEVIRYETLSLEAGRFRIGEEPFSIDINRVRQFRPVRSRNLVLGEFTFNLPVIIMDLKDGIFKKSYPARKTFLVFTQEWDQLRVHEINDFGRDFLERCDGTRTVQSICAELYSRYGGDVDDARFFEFCVEAVQVLGRMRLLRPERSETDPEGGEMDAEGERGGK